MAELDAVSFGGIPIIVDKWMPEGSVLLVDKNGPRPSIRTDSLQTMKDAIDADFLSRCGIVTNIKIKGDSNGRT